MATSLYLGKIPMAALTFWLFKSTKQRLLKYGWFAWLYERFNLIVDKIKSTQIYENIIKRAKRVKEFIRSKISDIKNRVKPKRAGIFKRLKRLKDKIKKNRT